MCVCVCIFLAEYDALSEAISVLCVPVPFTSSKRCHLWHSIRHVHMRRYLQNDPSMATHIDVESGMQRSDRAVSGGNQAAPPHGCTFPWPRIAGGRGSMSVRPGRKLGEGGHATVCILTEKLALGVRDPVARLSPVLTAVLQCSSPQTHAQRPCICLRVIVASRH